MFYLSTQSCLSPANSGPYSAACAEAWTFTTAHLRLIMTRRAATATLSFITPSLTGWTGLHAAPAPGQHRPPPAAECPPRARTTPTRGGSRYSARTFNLCLRGICFGLFVHTIQEDKALWFCARWNKSPSAFLVMNVALLAIRKKNGA